MGCWVSSTIGVDSEEASVRWSGGGIGGIEDSAGGGGGKGGGCGSGGGGGGGAAAFLVGCSYRSSKMMGSEFKSPLSSTQSIGSGGKLAKYLNQKPSQMSNNWWR